MLRAGSTRCCRWFRRFEGVGFACAARLFSSWCYAQQLLTRGVMFFFDPLQTDVSKHVNENVSHLSKVIWQVLATVVTIGVPTVFKWVQDHSRTQRRMALTERVSALAKSISELPAEATGLA